MAIVGRNDRPKFGQWATFTHYSDKPTNYEIEERCDELDGEEGTIKRVRRENPTPEIPALIVGVSSVSVDGDLNYGEADGHVWVNWADAKSHKRFYVLKRNLRGRRYYVALEDVHPIHPNGTEGENGDSEGRG